MIAWPSGGQEEVKEEVDDDETNGQCLLSALCKTCIIKCVAIPSWISIELFSIQLLWNSNLQKTHFAISTSSYLRRQIFIATFMDTHPMQSSLILPPPPQGIGAFIPSSGRVLW